MRPVRNFILGSIVLGSVSIIGAFAHAQSVDDPTPIQGNMVTDTARDAAMNSSLDVYTRKPKSKEAEAKSQADKARVNTLISQYSDCKYAPHIRELSRDRKQLHRESCRQQFQPKFANACVGGASSIAICTRLKSKGSIE